MRSWFRHICWALVGIFLGLSSGAPLQAQKFGYIDSEYILRQLPDYKESMRSIDSLAKTWEKDVKQQLAEVDKMDAQLKSEEVLLTEEMMSDRRHIIVEKYKEVEANREAIFGYDGLFFLKEKELLEPLQEKLYQAVKKVTKKHRLQLILDKSHPGIIYINPVHDYSEYVMEALGVSQTKNVHEQ